MHRILLFFAALLLPAAPALAQDLEGDWAFRVDEATIFIFAISQDDTGQWSGAWQRPQSFVSNGMVFSRMQGSETVRSMRGRMVDGDVELTFDDPRPGAVPDIFRITQTSPNQASLLYVGTQLEPYPLVRVAPGGSIGPFDDAMIYDRDNAVTEAEYVAPAVPSQDAPEPAPEAPSRLDDGFLDDVRDTAPSAEPARPSIAAESVMEAEAAETRNARSCTDFSADSPPGLAVLEARWGADYESVGNGLDIRDYRMDNGDIARITLLDDRVYINRCGPAD